MYIDTQFFFGIMNRPCCLMEVTKKGDYLTDKIFPMTVLMSPHDITTLDGTYEHTVIYGTSWPGVHGFMLACIARIHSLLEYRRTGSIPSPQGFDL